MFHTCWPFTGDAWKHNVRDMLLIATVRDVWMRSVSMRALMHRLDVMRVCGCACVSAYLYANVYVYVCVCVCVVVFCQLLVYASRRL